MSILVGENVFTFSIFFGQNFFEKMNYDFHFSLEIWNLFFLIALVYLTNTVIRKKTKVASMLRFWKKSIFLSKLFQKNELLFSFFVRIMRAIISSLLLCFWKRPCLKRKKSVDSILRFWKKSLLLHFFFEFFFEKMNRHFHNFSMDFHNHNLTI